MTVRRTPIPCPLCDSSNFTVLYEPWVEEDSPEKLYGAASGIRGTQRLVSCDDCGLVYENPRLPADAIIRGYMSSDDSSHDSQYAMRVASFYRALVKLKTYLPPRGARILDIGTAGGSFLEAAARMGYDAHGLEPSRDLVERGNARGLQIQQGTIEDRLFKPDSFDMVTLWDVIEHLPEPRSALHEVRRLLKPNGILLVNYPDIGTWQAKLTGQKFWWILSVHLQHFSRRTMRELCRRTGFDVIHYRRYWQVLEFGYLERMAIHYRMPLAGLITRLTPGPIQRIPIPYYASQTTALARPKS